MGLYFQYIWLLLIKPSHSQYAVLPDEDVSTLCIFDQPQHWLHGSASLWSTDGQHKDYPGTGTSPSRSLFPTPIGGSVLIILG